MRNGAIALARVQQADGRLKSRPVVVLQEMPPYAAVCRRAGLRGEFAAAS
jgi:hypothetical protein